MKRLVTCLLVSVLVCTSAAADTVRGDVREVLDPPAVDSASSVSAGDIVSVRAPVSDPLVSALKIDIAIPQAVAGMRGAFAVYLYKGARPDPDSGATRFTAEKIDYFLLPPSRTMSIHIPLAEDYRGTESFDVVVLDEPLDSAAYPLLLTITPIMKGMPAAAARSTFGVSAALISSKTGVLRMNLIYPEGDELPVDLEIDSSPAQAGRSEYFLPEGLHTLRVASRHYVDLTRTFTIKGGEYTDLSLVLESRSSRLLVEAPENALVFLDGDEIPSLEPGGLDIDPGEHTVLVKIGDYSLSKQFDVMPGMTYTISLQMEIIVESR